jgi:acetyl esterase/lipase
MKKIVLLLLLTSILIATYGQRYLKPVFSATTITKDILYGNAPNYQNIGTALKLDVYEPTGDVLSKRPIIVYMHGGGFTDVNQTKSFPHIAMMCDSFARRGYVTASLDYRLDTSISNRAIINAMHDARAAVRFFKANAATYKIDTSKIFLGGESAGAINALSVNYIDKVSELAYPPVAPYSNVNTVEGNSGNPGYISKTKATLCFCGGTKTVLLDPVFDTSDIQTADPKILQLHGTSDPLIPIQYALEIAYRAIHVGVPHVFRPLTGATHCPWFWTLPNWQSYLDTLIHHTSVYLYEDIVTSTNEKIAAETKISIYPNPLSSAATLQLPGNYDHATLIIFNSNGQIVKQMKNISARTIVLNRDNLPSGIYYMRLIQDDKMSATDKIVIIDN